MSRRNLLLGHLLIPLLYGFLDLYVMSKSAPKWYIYFNEPFFSPPFWVYVPIITIFYLMNGFSAYLIDISKSKTKEKILKYYWVQLIANFLWPIIFFGLFSPRLAFIEIMILWLLVYKTLFEFFRISKTASYILLICIVLVTFAATLNLSVIILNWR